MILPMVEDVLAECGIPLQRVDAVAFGCGPGSFTGVRIAAGVAQGIAFAADLPVIPVSTLAALALEAIRERLAEWIYPCIDARMGEVYFGAYRCDGEGMPALQGVEQVLPPALAVFPGGARGVGIGSGWASYRSVLIERAGGFAPSILEDRFPRAGQVARIGAVDFGRGKAVPAEQALPNYLRDEVAKKPPR